MTKNLYSIMGYGFAGNKKLFHFDKNKLPYRKVNGELNNGKTYLYIQPLQTMCKTFANGKEAYLYAKNNLRISNYFAIKKINNENWFYNFFLKPYIIKSEYKLMKEAV